MTFWWVGVLSVAVAVLAGLLAQAHLLVPAVAAVYLVLSVTAFVGYLLDKRAAEQGARRIPEKNLHLVGLVGGWPGALLAQRLLHHKTRKRSFQAVFWITVIAHCGALAWFGSPSASLLPHHLK